MPFILIIIGIGASLGLGGYMWSSSKPKDTIPVVTTTESTVETPGANETTPDTSPAENTSDTAYADGTYTADVTYTSPDRLTHPVKVSLTIEDDVVTASDVVFGGEVSGATAVRQTAFAAAYKTMVVGKSLDSINLSRVGGSSLTTNAFNEAKAKIEAEAAV